MFSFDDKSTAQSNTRANTEQDDVNTRAHSQLTVVQHNSQSSTTPENGLTNRADIGQQLEKGMRELSKFPGHIGDQSGDGTTANY